MTALTQYFLTIAETTVEVSSIDPEMSLQLGETEKRFQAANALPDLQIEASFGTTAIPHVSSIFDTGGVWKVYCQNDSYLFTFSSPVFGPLPYKTAEFNAGFSCGRVFLHRPYFSDSYQGDPLKWPLDEVLISHLLGLGRGVELHAAGLVDARGRGHLFVGHSGAGKSTMTRLWEDHTGVVILSDDRIVLRRKAGQFVMYGTPWHGDTRHAAPASTPVSAIYLLEHSDTTRLIPLSAPQAVARLFAMSIAAVYCREAVEFTLGFLNRLADIVPCFALPFVPDTCVKDFVLNGGVAARTNSATYPCHVSGLGHTPMIAERKYTQPLTVANTKNAHVHGGQ